MTSRDVGPVMLDVDSVQLSKSERSLLERPGVGGVILFARNYHNKKQLIELVSDIRMVRPELLICVDQEGGRVQRFREGFTRLPPMQVFSSHYQNNPAEALALAEGCGWLMAVEILACGLDFSLAPVLDVDRDRCQAIGNRAFSDNVNEVVALAGAFIKGMRQAGMAATGKHFPGHGSVEGDSHVSSPVDERSFETIFSTDMQPFVTLGTELDAIMPAHVIFSSVDPEPVGFSSYWLKTVLREKLGFKGVIFSDDLSMEAASTVGGFAERAFAAVDAGCDMVLACNQREGAVEILDAFASAGVQVAGKLPAMRAKVQWNWTDLVEMERWKALNQALSRLC